MKTAVEAPKAVGTQIASRLGHNSEKLPPPKKRGYPAAVSASVETDAPLAGISVVDFTMNLPGPYSTMVLHGLGAEVTKIEPPRGDTARLFPRMFEILNAGKRSVVLDLKRDDDVARARELIAASDVVVEGFRPGVMARFGLDAATLRAQQPALVYCSLSGFGQQGPDAVNPGHDLNFQALTGVCHMLRDASGRPLGAALPIADLSSAMTAVTATVAALFRRERTGQGQSIDVAMTDTLLSWAYVWAEGLTPSDARLSGLVPAAVGGLCKLAGRLPAGLGGLSQQAADWLGGDAGLRAADAVGERIKKGSRYEAVTRLRLHALPHYTTYRTRDGRYLAVGIVDENKFWRALCSAMGMGVVAKLPMLGRFALATPLRRTLGMLFARRDLADWLELLDRKRVPVAPVLTLAEALEDPQNLTRRHGSKSHVRAPWPLSRACSEPAPKLGEHT